MKDNLIIHKPAFKSTTPSVFAPFLVLLRFGKKRALF